MKEKIIVLGAGESGTGAALLAKAKGHEVFVSDQNAIKDKYKDDLIRNKIEFEEGGHSLDRILNAALIIKSPGIPAKIEVIQLANSKGIEIIDEIEFGFRYCSGKIIAITGTNGKTTTTLLIYHLLKSAGFSVTLAGNVGESFARKLANGNSEWYVLEVSSYQLDGIKTFKPQIAVLLNITIDHMDRYENSMDKYTASKFKITQNMKTDDHFIFYAGDEMIKKYMKTNKVEADHIPVSLSCDESSVVCFDGEAMNFSDKDQLHITQAETTLRGPHNLVNTMASVAAAQLAGVKNEAILSGLKNFKNAPHRLEWITTIKGVDFVNDSKATNVDSVIYALGSYSQPLVWIAGGIDKGNDYNLIKDQVQKQVRALICLGKDNKKLNDFFRSIVSSVSETQDVRELVRMALEQAKTGDVVLLSPACASFDLFKNYEDRGDQFRKAVLELKKEVENQFV